MRERPHHRTFPLVLLAGVLLIVGCVPTYVAPSVRYRASADELIGVIIAYVQHPDIRRWYSENSTYDPSIGGITSSYLQVDFRLNGRGVATEITLNAMALALGGSRYTPMAPGFSAVFTFYEDGTGTYVTGNGQQADGFIRDVIAHLDQRFSRVP